MPTKTRKKISTGTKVRIALCALAPLSLALAALAKAHPEATERLYSRGFYPAWASFWQKLTSRFYFSLGEVLILLLIASLLVCLVLLARMLIRKTPRRGARLRTCLLTLAAAASCVLFWFEIAGGLNYYRSTFTAYSGLEPQPSEVSVLGDLCDELVGKANALRACAREDSRGVFTLEPRAYRELADTAARSFGTLTARYDGIFDLSASTVPKRVLCSRAMSYMQIVGVWFAFTGEANVNVHCTDYNIPDTMCHELSHISGFMREDEANYIGYLACMASGDSDFEYSGTLSALIHAGNALASRSPQRYSEVMSRLSDGVRRDLEDNTAYWKEYESSFGDFSTSVNDTYLKANSQTDGVASYGRMVDLLLAQYKLDHGIA